MSSPSIPGPRESLGSAQHSCASSCSAYECSRARCSDREESKHTIDHARNLQFCRKYVQQIACVSDSRGICDSSSEAWPSARIIGRIDPLVCAQHVLIDSYNRVRDVADSLSTGGSVDCSPAFETSDTVDNRASSSNALWCASDDAVASMRVQHGPGLGGARLRKPASVHLEEQRPIATRGKRCSVDGHAAHVQEGTRAVRQIRTYSRERPEHLSGPSGLRTIRNRPAWGTAARAATRALRARRVTKLEPLTQDEEVRDAGDAAPSADGGLETIASVSSLGSPSGSPSWGQLLAEFPP